MSSVQTKNKHYEDAAYQRKLARDSIGGSPAIKRNNVLYLPMPKGYEMWVESPNYTGSANLSNQSRDAEFSIINAPWYHKNAAYMAYLQRARYPEFVTVARNGLIGIATKQTIEFKLPSVIDYLIEDAGRNKESLILVLTKLIAETLSQGNVFPILDVNPNDNTFFIDIVTAEDAIDWDESEGGDGVKYFNVQRNVEERAAENKFLKKTCIYNYVWVEENKTVVFEEYKDGIKVEKTNDLGTVVERVLNIQGKKFTRVPVFPIGAIENVCKPQTAPLNGLAEICLAIFRKDADLSNAQYMTCNPNLVITGVETDAPNQGYDQAGELDPEYAHTSGMIPVVAGSQVAMQFSNKDAKVFYTKTDTSALDHMLKAIENLFYEAAIYSLSLTGKDTGSKEAEGTVKMRQGFQSATLITVVKNCVIQLTNLLRYAAEIEGANPDEVEININYDFSDKTITADFFKALITLFSANGISLETILNAAIQAGVEISDVNEEMKKIQNAEPKI